MGYRNKWGRQPHLSNLYWLTIKELTKIYPSYSKGTIKGKKYYWIKKVKEGEVGMPPPPENEPTTHEGQLGGRLYKTWETSAFDREAGEWTTTTNHGYEYTQGPEELAEVFEPVEPARITPTRRKKIERLGRQLLVFGDSQIGYRRVYDQNGDDELIPTHSEEALDVLRQVNAHEQPDEIINLSDTIDLAELSRFDPDSDNYHRTLGPSFRRVHDFYAQLRADNPWAKITEVDSNHTARAQKQMLKRYPEWYGFTLPGEDYPMMSYYRLANLDPLDVDFISGYGSAEYLYGEEHDKPPIVFKHGTNTSSTPGGVVRKELSNNPEVNVVRGHGHSHEHVTRTNRNGDYLHYIQLGTTCATDGRAPSYGSSVDDFGRPTHNQENWQQQFMMVRDYEGTYQFDVIDIVNGIAHYNGERYNGNSHDA